MDPSVIAAMAKWPQVPDCYGWLALDRRGRWLLQGQPVTHCGLADFIGRNYVRHESGAWFMQNGPQRVWVELRATPWILHRDNDGGFVTHTGQAVRELQAGWLVDGEQLCFACEWGVGLVDDRDLAALADKLRDADGQPLAAGDRLSGLSLQVPGRRMLPLQECASGDLPRIGGFTAQPQPPA
jgi:hypothetical protein